MELIFSGPTAFALHRIPPQYREVLPHIPFVNASAHWRTVLKGPLFLDLVKPPLYCLRQTRASCTGAKHLKDQLWLGDLPFGAILDYGLGFSVTSPLMTLFMLARTPGMTDVRLIMAMYEICGSFSLFTPGKEMKIALEAARQVGIRPYEEWRPVKDAAGKPSGLWSRSPLATPEELGDFAHSMRSYRGGARFARCAALVTGVCASPLEVQASMLFSLPPSLGGQGFASLENNKEIKLSADARIVSGRARRCYGDLYFENTASDRPLDIECQSSLIHDRLESFISDSDRTAALQIMGIEVLPLTYDQLYDPDKYSAICSHIARALGTEAPDMSGHARKMEIELRHALFTCWDAPFA